MLQIEKANRRRISLDDAFFSATKHALKNITSVYEMIWPISVGLWNLRCMVAGMRLECAEVTESLLANKFSVGSGIHGVNYKKAFTDTSWEEQKKDFAWLLLNNIFPIYEGWLEELKEKNFSQLVIKRLQYPDKIRGEISSIISSPSNVLKNAFYGTYSQKKYRNYSRIVEWMRCFRVFKEMRNCYMHNGSIADTALLDAYADYLPYATVNDLGVKEVPELQQPMEGDPIDISLRGVVGFSFIMLRIIVSVDAELLCACEAEKEFLERFEFSHRTVRTLKPDINGARKQVEQYVRQCGFPTPKNPDEMKFFLLNHHLVSI